jgi:hypothetical protein
MIQLDCTDSNCGVLLAWGGLPYCGRQRGTDEFPGMRNDGKPLSEVDGGCNVSSGLPYLPFG